MIDDLFAMFVTRLALVCIRILISELCILIVPFDKNIYAWPNSIHNSSYHIFRMGTLLFAVRAVLYVFAGVATICSFARARIGALLIAILTSIVSSFVGASYIAARPQTP